MSDPESTAKPSNGFEDILRDIAADAAERNPNKPKCFLSFYRDENGAIINRALVDQVTHYLKLAGIDVIRDDDNERVRRDYASHVENIILGSKQWDMAIVIGSAEYAEKYQSRKTANDPYARFRNKFFTALEKFEKNGGEVFSIVPRETYTDAVAALPVFAQDRANRVDLACMDFKNGILSIIRKVYDIAPQDGRFKEIKAGVFQNGFDAPEDFQKRDYEHPSNILQFPPLTDRAAATSSTIDDFQAFRERCRKREAVVPVVALEQGVERAAKRLRS